MDTNTAIILGIALIMNTPNDKLRLILKLAREVINRFK